MSISATAVGGAGAKTLLSAIASGVTGSKLAIDKNFFYEKTVAVLVTAMNAERKTALIPIMVGRNQAVEQYSLPQALADLDAYYRAGTFLGALQALQADAGVKEAKAENALNRIRTTKFQDDSAGRALQKFWMPKWVPGAGTPELLEVNEANQARLEKWLSDAGLPNIPLPQFITGSDFAELRKRAVKELNVPSSD